MAADIYALAFFTDNGLVVRCFGHKAHLKSSITAWEDWCAKPDGTDDSQVIRVIGISTSDKSETHTSVMAMSIRVMNMAKVQEGDQLQTETKVEKKT